MQAAAVDAFGSRAGHLANGYDFAGTDPEIADAFTVLIDDGPAFEDQLVSFGHHPSASNRRH